MLLQRVDIVTGGASAVYGSDAVTGAVNFIINPKFNGLKINSQAGISHYRDDRTIAVGMAAAWTVRRPRPYRRQCRDPATSRASCIGAIAPSAATGTRCRIPAGCRIGPYVLVADARNSRNSFNGMIRSGPLGIPGIHPERRRWRRSTLATTSTAAQYHQGGSGSYDDTTLQTPLTQNQFYGRFDFDFTRQRPRLCGSHRRLQPHLGPGHVQQPDDGEWQSAGGHPAEFDQSLTCLRRSSNTLAAAGATFNSPRPSGQRAGIAMWIPGSGSTRRPWG